MFPSNIWVIKSRRMRWAGHVAHMGKRGAYRILVGRPEGRRLLGRHLCTHLQVPEKSYT